MINSKSVLWFAILLAVLLESTAGRKGLSSGHSYPKSHGLSGGGHRPSGLSGGGHGYPSSGGSHSYPSSGGSHSYPSSGGSHGYPSSGGSHGYPSSGGLSGSGTGSHGYPSSGGSHSYPSSGGSHSYPSSGGSHGYPSSGSGLSGNNRYPSQNKPTVHHTTNVYNYHYSPPQRITYSPVRGSPPVSYPVYHGTPPTYIYQYKNSGSKYGTLLAGLALLNLGTLAGAAYAHSHNSNPQTHYKPQPGEVCKFAVKRDNGDYEETKIDCQIISSFILQDQGQLPNTGTNSTVTVVTVTNTTVMNTSNMTNTPAPSNPLYQMLPNGTLVPVNATVPVVPPMPTPMPVNPMSMSPNLSPNGTVMTSSVVTTTTTNTTLVNALDVKGRPVEVTPGMQCFVIRNTPTTNMRKHVPCGLLQTYAEKSLRRNSATRNVPMFTIVAAIVAVFVAF
ncbi:uncharacterized protein LOC110372580 [Helicoverpa armigera]|uniref:uncharacterized protein LOC110372580 n=1 Tax=Helicoverpa armigera TaxID=29058 RepID=UPI003082CF94